MKKSEKIFLIALFSILTITVTIFAVIGLSSCQTAYADYNDLDGTEILNFNQLVNNQFINNYTFNDTSLVVADVSNNLNHYFYISFDFTSNATFINLYLNGYGILVQSYDRYSSDVYLIDTGSTLDFRAQGSGNDVTINNFMIIDLTLMFGSGNEPNLEQCQSLFVAEYYPYTQSTPLTLNTFSGYEQALQDIFSSYKYALSMNALSYTSYAVAYKNASANFDYNTSTEQWYFENTFAVPLFTVLNSGAQMTVDYWLYAPNLSGEWYFNVMIWNGNEYQTIYTAQEQIDTTEAQTMTFNLPLNADTLYFNVVYNNSINTSANFIVNKLNISASQLDINSMVHNAFISGQNDMARQYAPNGTKYLDIFNEGVRASQTNGAVFQDTWSFVGSAFTGIGGLLAVELIPNVPIGLFVAFPLLLGLIFFIVKVTKGGD